MSRAKDPHTPPVIRTTHTKLSDGESSTAAAPRLHSVSSLLGTPDWTHQCCDEASDWFRGADSPGRSWWSFVVTRQVFLLFCPTPLHPWGGTDGQRHQLSVKLISWQTAAETLTHQTEKRLTARSNIYFWRSKTTPVKLRVQVSQVSSCGWVNEAPASTTLQINRDSLGFTVTGQDTGEEIKRIISGEQTEAHMCSPLPSAGSSAVTHRDARITHTKPHPITSGVTVR